MGSVKRKPVEDATEDSGTPASKQRRENDLVMGASDEPVACLHDVSYPDKYVPCTSNSILNNQGDSKPAKEFPFKLDPFQLEAVNCLDKGESVMVMLFFFLISSSAGVSLCGNNV